MAVVLTEHALAHQGQSRESAALIAGWPLATPLPVLRRELSYWVADTLLARKDYRAAFDVAFAAWSDAGGAANHELRWRLASVALLALRGLPAVPNGATIPPSFKPDLDQLAGEWGPAAVELYFRRPDLAALRRKVS
jgi:hypothetical protein